MKKLLTILVLLLGVVSLHATITETTLWESTYTDGIELNSETVATFQAGDKLRVYATVPSDGDNFKIVYKGASNDWAETTIPSIGTQWPWINGDETYKDFTLTTEDITALSGMNIYIYKGENSTINKVTIANEITLCSKTIPLNATISACKFTNVSAGDVVKFTVASVSAENLSIELKVAGGNWSTCNTFASVTGEATYSYQITSTDIENGLKTHGLSIEKSDGTISVSSIKLRTNGEVPDDPTLSLDNFESDNYDKTNHTLTLTEWGSMSLDLGFSTSSQGSQLIIKTSSACNLKMSGTYLDGTEITTVNETGDGTLNHVLALDNTKLIKTIKVETGSTVTFTELALDPTYTLTKSATNGSISVSTNGGTSTTTDTSFGYGTVLTLTATPSSGYGFTDWTIGDTAPTGNPITYTITGDVTVTANFTTIPAFSLDGFAVSNDDASIVSYDTSTHKMTTTEGWKGAQLWIGNYSTYSGNKLVIRTSEECKLKISVGYTDDTSGTDLEEGSATKVRAYTLDPNKKIQKVIIQNQEARTITFTEFALDPTYTLTTSAENGSVGVSPSASGVAYGTELTLTATPATGYDFSKWTIDGTDYTDNPHTYTITGNVTATATFSAIKAFTLDNFEQGDDCTYDKSSHQMTTTAGWKGITLTVGDNSTYSGSVLVFKTSEDCQLKLYVSYVGGGSDENIESTASKIHALTIDKEKKIKDVTVQNQATETITITFTSMALDPTYTVTKSVENGDFTISTDGGSTTTDATTFAYGKELTLTAVPASGYKFVKWKIDGGDAGTDATITHTIIADVTVNPIFEEKAGLLAEGETRLLWFNADGEELTWGSHAAQSAEIGDIVEAGEILIVTAKSVDSSDGHYPKIYLLDASGNEIQIESETILIDPMVVGENRLTITEAIREKIADGFKFKGCDATITKLELYKPEPIKRLAEEETKTLWSNSEGVALAWNSVTIDRAAEWGAVLEEDERIIITVKTKDSSCEWPTVALANSSGSIGSTANLLNDLTMPAELTITLTAEMVAKMKNGFNITGDGATITKAVLYKPTMPTKKTYTLNETETAISDDANVTVAAEKFVNISAYDVLTVNFAITGTEAKLILKGNGEGGGWDYLKEMTFKDSETLFALPLTPAMTANLKKNGLQITGSDYTFKSVTLKSAGEVPSDVEEEEEKIFDEEGEADLTEMKGQDSSTTVTTNSDGSITMTTTAAYKAAQIWFDDPEEVTGNVLKVEIAEANVNVTVTVTYTDGSQSQMSSTTTSSARAMTRASAGTTIKVPIETGKQVQNIEVKNANAGTITIQKMAMVTENVFDSNGQANLTMVKPQSNATYDVTTHTLATTKGWTGATVTPISSETVSGEELLVRFSAAAQVKVAVKYRTDVEGPNTIMESPATSVRLTLDKSKAIQEIMIQPTTASILTFTEITVNGSATEDDVEQIFTNGKADLSKFVSQDENKVIYDSTKHIIKATEGWTGVQVELGTGQQVSGKELKVTFDGEAKVKLAVTYTNGQSVNTIMEDADNVVRLALDGSKKIAKIEIQPTEAGNITLKEVVLNKEPEDLSLKQGETRDLWLSGSGEALSWSEVAHQKKSVGSLLQEFDEVLITVSGVAAGNDWPKVFLRDLQSNQIGKEVLLNDVTNFPYIVRIPLNHQMAEQVQKGFCICGDGVTVTKLQVYRPYAPKAGDIHLKALDYGYNSSYDATTYTVTTTARWAARGWEVGDSRYNNKDMVIVKFEAVDFPVTLKMEYVDGNGEKQATSAGVAGGNTEATLNIPSGIQKIGKVFLIFQNPGSVSLTEASVVTMNEARTRGFINDSTDGTTGIEEIENGKLNIENGVYDLQGRRISQPTSKGVYIKDGRKIVIKK